MKTCKRCGDTKALRNFRIAHDKHGREYRSTYCYDCHRDYMRSWRESKRVVESLGD